FSSRRRHTRFSRDWSSDVCSSDLLAQLGRDEVLIAGFFPGGRAKKQADHLNQFLVTQTGEFDFHSDAALLPLLGVGFAGQPQLRSEERRVGKEGRSRWRAVAFSRR